jgi:hypothetical protein
MEIGTKFEVIKGGQIDVCGPVRLKIGEIWDLVSSEVCGPEFRKLNQRGGCTLILNGRRVAGTALAAGKVRVMDPGEPKSLAHDELRKRTGAR